jgi:hypothetical protein
MPATSHNKTPLNVFTVTTQRLSDLAVMGTLFTWHLRLEAVPLLEREPITSRILERAAPVDIERESKRLLKSIALYREPSRFGGEFQLALSHMYVLAKRAAMLTSAMAGAAEFSPSRVFDAAAGSAPDLRESFDELRFLEAFRRRWLQAGQCVELPNERRLTRSHGMLLRVASFLASSQTT